MKGFFDRSNPSAEPAPPAKPAATKAKEPAAVKPDGRTGATWFKMQFAFIDSGMLATVGPAAGVIWFAMNARAKKGLVSETQEQIAATTGLSVRHVERSIGVLRDHDLLVQISRGSKHKGPSIFRIFGRAQGESQPDAGVGIDNESQPDAGVAGIDNESQPDAGAGGVHLPKGTEAASAETAAASRNGTQTEPAEATS